MTQSVRSEGQQGFEPNKVPFGGVFCVYLGQPRHIHNQLGLADFMHIGNGRGHAIGFGFETAELCSGAAVAGNSDQRMSGKIVFLFKKNLRQIHRAELSAGALAPPPPPFRRCDIL